MKILGRFFKPNIEKLEKKKDTEGLLKLLRKEIKTGEDLEIRAGAALALGRIGDERAFEPLGECLREIDKLLNGLRPNLAYSTDIEDPAKALMLSNTKSYIFDAYSTLEARGYSQFNYP